MGNNAKHICQGVIGETITASDRVSLSCFCPHTIYLANGNHVHKLESGAALDAAHWLHLQLTPSCRPI